VRALSTAEANPGRPTGRGDARHSQVRLLPRSTPAAEAERLHATEPPVPTLLPQGASRGFRAWVAPTDAIALTPQVGPAEVAAGGDPRAPRPATGPAAHGRLGGILWLLRT
jgi:hypothetical protein